MCVLQMDIYRRIDWHNPRRAVLFFRCSVAGDSFVGEGWGVGVAVCVCEFQMHSRLHCI